MMSRGGISSYPREERGGKGKTDGKKKAPDIMAATTIPLPKKSICPRYFAVRPKYKPLYMSPFLPRDIHPIPCREEPFLE
jgi:hypothetical protein